MEVVEPALRELRAKPVVVALVADRGTGVDGGEDDPKVLGAVTEGHQLHEGPVELRRFDRRGSRGAVRVEPRWEREGRSVLRAEVGAQRHHEALGRAVRDHPVEIEGQQLHATDGSRD